jgi:predicted transcriptional regulator
MPKRQLGQDFEELLADARQVPGVAEYLDSYTIKLGNEVFARRIAMKLSQKALADLAGTNQAHISKIEAGDDSVTGKVLNKVMAVLDIDSLNIGFKEYAAARELVLR